MQIEEVMKSGLADFSGIPSSYYLLGLLSAFENRFQAMADSTMQEISWKQFFAIICINMCREAPTLKELSEILGSSHQNVKQILLKLEKKNFIRFRADETDKRKQRIELTDEYEISMKACGIYSLICGGEADMNLKMKMAYVTITSGKLDSEIRATINLKEVGEAVAMYDFSESGD